MAFPFILAGKSLLASSEGEIAVERAFTFRANSVVVLARGRRRKGPTIFLSGNNCRFITGTLSEGRLRDVVGGSHDGITTIAAVIAVTAVGSTGSWANVRGNDFLPAGDVIAVNQAGGKKGILTGISSECKLTINRGGVYGTGVGIGKSVGVGFSGGRAG
jgi:hypothetical protein